MNGFDICETTVSPPHASPEVALPRIVVRNDGPEVAAPAGKSSPQPMCDGVRQLAVVVWARTKLLERTLASQVGVDRSLLAGLAKIDAAITAITEPLDALEDVLPKQAA